MLYLAFVFHMHQPYYKNLLTQEIDVPWVRLHGVKDYLDMVLVLEKYPKICQTFNLVPSLIEQIEDYTYGGVKDIFLEISQKPAQNLTSQEKDFILKNFFCINKEKVISIHPRYYELYVKYQAKKEFSAQDYLDLQVWHNLSWIDPLFRKNNPKLKAIVGKARFFTEEDKGIVLDAQAEILKQIVPAYKKLMETKQIEVSISPYYHPILPLLFDTDIAREANPKVSLPKIKFAYPQDMQAQIQEAADFYRARFGSPPCGMWPSEEAVSEQILPDIINAGISWIVADEGILFKSLKSKKRDAKLLYQPHILKRKAGSLNIVFRDRNLSDLLGFVYHQWKAELAVDDFIKHLENISALFKKKDILVTIAMDGENAWEYYANDGYDFLGLLYARLSDSKHIKTTTINSYLKMHPANNEIKHLAAGSWIYSEFGKWIGNPDKVRLWECLARARDELNEKIALARKQMYILEGSDWFWWAGEDPNGDFDKLFRMHLANFYTLIGKKPIPP